jgi:hypothetical protein
VRYAAKISNNDLDFLATLDAENGLWTPDRQHDTPYWNGGKTIKGKYMPPAWYNDHGLCGTSDYYHWDIVEDPRFLTDPYWQLNQCWELYSRGTRFYGFDNRWKSKSNFTCNE